LSALGFLQDLQAKKVPTSGLEPLYCSLQVINRRLQGFARACESPISKELLQGVSSSLACCVLQGFVLEVVSEWCQEPALEPGALYEGAALSVPYLVLDLRITLLATYP
jgi:hypothetical protein